MRVTSSLLFLCVQSEADGAGRCGPTEDQGRDEPKDHSGQFPESGHSQRVQVTNEGKAKGADND